MTRFSYSSPPIDTVNVSSELITAIYAAFAQKESESISGNMRWSYQRRMESGTFLPSSMAYGYRLDGKKIVIDPEAALISKDEVAVTLQGGIEICQKIMY